MASPRISLSHDLDTEHTIDDGYFALLLAVIELAWRDAAIDLESLYGLRRRRAEAHRNSAIAFLHDMEMI